MYRSTRAYSFVNNLQLHGTLPLKVSHLPSSTPCPLRCNPALRLSAAGPHTLEVAVPLGEPVHAVVALAHRAHETAQGVGLVLAGVAAVLVNVADGDLGGGVVGGLDDAVRRGALTGDVTFRRDTLSVCAFFFFLAPSCHGWRFASHA